MENDDLGDYRPHVYAGIKHLRNFPVSRSLAEDHRRTAFFGVSPIQCAAVDMKPEDVELFKRGVPRNTAGRDPIGYVGRASRVRDDGQGVIAHGRGVLCYGHCDSSGETVKHFGSAGRSHYASMPNGRFTVAGHTSSVFRGPISLRTILEEGSMDRPMKIRLLRFALLSGDWTIPSSRCVLR